MQRHRITSAWIGRVAFVNAFVNACVTACVLACVAQGTLGTSRALAQSGETPTHDRIAQEHFKLGREYYDRGQYENAAREFEDAYRLSHRPKLLYNLYLAYRNLGRFGPAGNALQAYLAATPNDPRERELRERVREMDEAMRASEPSTPQRSAQPAQELPAYVTTPASPPASSESRAETPDAHRPSAQDSSPTASAANTLNQDASQEPKHGELRADTDVDDDDDADVDAKLGASHDEGPSLVAPLVLGGVGVAALVTGGVMQALANDTHDDLLRLCPNKDCSQAGPRTATRARDLQDRGDTYVTLSYVFFAASVLSIGVGAGLYVSDVLDDDSKSPTRAKLRCGPDRCVATLRGHF